jgi:spore coat polysaccharide biosynthesis protein SpsF
LVRTYPRGLDTEVVSRDALEKAWRRSSGPKYRAHVTSYVYLHPDEFSLVSVTGPTDQSEFRWTVDTDLDLDVVRDIYAAGANELMLSWQDALAIVRAARNRTVRQKALEEG